MSLVQRGKLLRDLIVCRKQKPNCPRRGIANGLTKFRTYHFYHCLDERARCKVLTGATFSILRVLLEQTFVDFAFGIDIQPYLGFAIDQHDEPFEFGRVLDLILRLAEDGGDQARARTEIF